MNALSQCHYIYFHVNCRPECYHLLEHNCNTFSNELANFLTGNGIPSHITSLPQDVLNT